MLKILRSVLSEVGRNKTRSAEPGDRSIFLMEDAIKLMRPPSEMQIICIDVTNKCDLACSNCTRLLENQDDYWEMSLANFRNAAQSLRNFPGTVAVIGGNPCMHRNFNALCKILCDEIPEKSRRGLWTNNIFSHESIAIETFGVFNLNPHNNPRGIESLARIKELGWYHEGPSEHSSILAAIQDFFTEDEMWRQISACDINQQWSASITQNKGNLRAYFCEVAAAFDLARGEDHGVPVTPDWWKEPLQSFAHQIAHFCPKCGVPARIGATPDCDEIDTYSVTNRPLKNPDR